MHVYLEVERPQCHCQGGDAAVPGQRQGAALWVEGDEGEASPAAIGEGSCTRFVDGGGGDIKGGGVCVCASIREKQRGGR
jgi:hypothetical protein